jgi:hypothetical protein
MKIFVARIKSNVSLRGRCFPKGMIVKVWMPSGTYQIQPYYLPSPVHEVVWYSLPGIHARHLQFMEEWEENLAELGFFD